MRKIDLEEMKALQLQILKEVTEFCGKNKINYWLDCGTLLGAIRHKGYIPWDDDIDIGMLREDYNKFMKLFNKESKRYKFYSAENNSEFHYLFGKVLDSYTVLYEDKYKLAVNIDVFVYDNVPDNKQAIRKMYKNIYGKCFGIRYSWNGIQNKRKRKLAHGISLALRVVPASYLRKKAIENLKRYQYVPTKLVGNFTSQTEMVCSKEVFQKFIEVEFEGGYYKAPIGYDAWLRAFYNDYMKLPPLEERVPKHKTEAYWIGKEGKNNDL